MTITLTPKLVVTGADRAIDYYSRALGATVRQRHTMGTSVVFAELAVLGVALFLKDADEHDPSPQTLGRPGVLLEVTTDDPDGLAQQMVAAGGQVVFAVTDQPYGARAGRVRDPFGHEWLLQTPLTWSAEQIQAALEEAEG